MASLSGKLGLELELKSSAQKFWDGITNSNDVFPTIFPNQYKSIDLIQGDGKSVGSTRKIVFADAIPTIGTVTEKIDSFDEASKKLSYSTIDGDLLALYKVFDATLEVIPNGDGCVVKWSIAYEKTSEEIPEPELAVEMAKKTFKDFDAYLLKN